jgi:hypothetical protein
MICHKCSAGRWTEQDARKALEERETPPDAGQIARLLLGLAILIGTSAATAALLSTL